MAGSTLPGDVAFFRPRGRRGFDPAPAGNISTMLTILLLVLLVVLLLGGIGGPRYYRGRGLGRGRRTVVREYDTY